MLAEVVVYLVNNETKQSSLNLLYCLAQRYFNTLKIQLKPANWQIARNQYGKPYNLNYPQVHFSISHSGHYWMVAFSQSNIGLDLQLMSLKKDDTNDHYLKLAKRFFHQDEYEYLINHLHLKKSFFQIWCAKESYVKYLGTGISNNFKSFSCLTNQLYPVSKEIIHWPANEGYYYQGLLDDNYLYCLYSKNKINITLEAVTSLKDN